MVEQFPFKEWVAGSNPARLTNIKIFCLNRLNFYNLYNKVCIILPIYIKTEFLENLNDKLKTYLGFGLSANQNNYPPSNMDTLPLNKKVSLIMINWILKKILKNIIHYLPGFIRKKLRKNN